MAAACQRWSSCSRSQRLQTLLQGGRLHRTLQLTQPLPPLHRHPPMLPPQLTQAVPASATPTRQ